MIPFEKTYVSFIYYNIYPSTGKLIVPYYVSLKTIKFLSEDIFCTAGSLFRIYRSELNTPYTAHLLQP